MWLTCTLCSRHWTPSCTWGEELWHCRHKLSPGHGTTHEWHGTLSLHSYMHVWVKSASVLAPEVTGCIMRWRTMISKHFILLTNSPDSLVDQHELLFQLISLRRGSLQGFVHYLHCSWVRKIQNWVHVLLRGELWGSHWHPEIRDMPQE